MKGHNDLSASRSTSTSVVFATYNLLNLYYHETDPDEQARYERVYDVIRAADVDVLAVQEIIADDPDDPLGKADLAAKRLEQLAEAVGMTCRLPDGRAAVGVGNHRFHTGLLWKDGITSVGGFTAYSGTNVWHSLVKVHLDVGGYVVQHASYHAPPFGRHRRADEAELVLATMTRPDRPGRADDRPPGLIGADWNAVSADRVWRESTVPRTPGSRVLYDPDPYRGADVHGDLVYQTTWTFDDHGTPQFTADREAGEVLYLGGLRDAAAAVDAPWEPTVGHWPNDDPYGDRRIDAIRVTKDVVPALLSCSVSSRPSSGDGPGHTDPKTASDHLLTRIEYDPRRLSRRS